MSTSKSNILPLQNGHGSEFVEYCLLRYQAWSCFLGWPPAFCGSQLSDFHDVPQLPPVPPVSPQECSSPRGCLMRLAEWRCCGRTCTTGGTLGPELRLTQDPSRTRPIFWGGASKSGLNPHYKGTPLSVSQGCVNPGLRLGDEGRRIVLFGVEGVPGQKTGGGKSDHLPPGA